MAMSRWLQEALWVKKEEGGSSDLGVELRDLHIAELSGVDSPAHGSPDWLLMKQSGERLDALLSREGPVEYDETISKAEALLGDDEDYVDLEERIERLEKRYETDPDLAAAREYRERYLPGFDTLSDSEKQQLIDLLRNDPDAVTDFLAKAGLIEPNEAGGSVGDRLIRGKTLKITLPDR